MTGGFLLPLALLLPADLSGLAPADLAQQAEAELRQGSELRQSADRARPHYQQAAACLEELRRQGVHNALLERTLGNAYLLAGDLPRAILAYRRGLDLAPRDPSLHEALSWARDQVAYPDGSSGAHPPADDPLSLLLPDPFWLLVLVAGLHTLACVVLTRWCMTRRLRPLLLSAGCFLAAGADGLLLLHVQHQQQEHRLHPVVVIAGEHVPLRRGNGQAFPHVGPPLPRGAEGRRLFERGSWLQIELASGAVGWVPCDQVVTDEP